MDLQQQQKILDWFVADTKEYIDIIQEAFVKLSSCTESTEDRKSLDNIFRATFAIKGGAAMLGFSSIQKAVYTLEKYAKIFRECPIKVDSYLEKRLIQVTQSLKEILTSLEVPLDVNEDKSTPLDAQVEPVLQEIDQYLDILNSLGVQ